MSSIYYSKLNLAFFLPNLLSPPVFIFFLLHGPTTSLSLEVIPLSFPWHYSPHLISHETYHVHFLSVLLRNLLLSITQPHYFLCRPFQEPYNWPPQLPTDLSSTLQPVGQVYNKKIMSKHSLVSPKCSLTLRLDVLTTYTVLFVLQFSSVSINTSFSNFLKFSQKTTLFHSSVSLHMQP